MSVTEKIIDEMRLSIKGRAPFMINVTMGVTTITMTEKAMIVKMPKLIIAWPRSGGDRGTARLRSDYDRAPVG